MYAKVTQKGQITIPKAIREMLDVENGGSVVFVVDKDGIKLQGVPEPAGKTTAGCLKQYAKQYIPLSEIREQLKAELADAAAKEGLEE